MGSLRAGETGLVYAFEPDPYNYEALRLNIRRNHLTNVISANAALSNELGSMVFYASSGTIGGSLVRKSYVHDTHELRAATTTLDAEVAREQTDNLVVKLDVEGAEELVLRGGENTLRACKTGRVLAEHNPTALRDAGSSGSLVVGLLRSYGFAVYFIDEAQRKLISIDKSNLPMKKGNLLADKS
jgi:FkbM family methyltransferase